MPTTTYCSQQNIEDRKGFPKLAKLTGDPSGSVVDAPSVTSAINEFADKMNAAIRKRYPDLPFDQTHSYLNGLNIQGAYLLLERDSQRGWTDDHIEEWKLLNKELDNIAKGITDLRSETADEQKQAVQGYFSSNPQVFGRGQGL